eukprot:jgi/Chlat1/1126/Chrsp111S08643
MALAANFFSWNGWEPHAYDHHTAAGACGSSSSTDNYTTTPPTLFPEAVEGCLARFSVLGLTRQPNPESAADTTSHTTTTQPGVPVASPCTSDTFVSARSLPAESLSQYGEPTKPISRLPPLARRADGDDDARVPRLTRQCDASAAIAEDDDVCLSDMDGSDSRPASPADSDCSDEVSPMFGKHRRRSLSQCYLGKSRSFSSLTDLRVASIHEIVKPDKNKRKLQKILGRGGPVRGRGLAMVLNHEDTTSTTTMSTTAGPCSADTDQHYHLHRLCNNGAVAEPRSPYCCAFNRSASSSSLTAASLRSHSLGRSFGSSALLEPVHELSKSDSF